jgi:hypothetical protein
MTLEGEQYALRKTCEFGPADGIRSLLLSERGDADAA